MRIKTTTKPVYWAVLVGLKVVASDILAAGDYLASAHLVVWDKNRKAFLDKVKAITPDPVPPPIDERERP